MKNKELDKDVQRDLIDVLTERPVKFVAGGKTYFLYQPTLGKVLLVQKEMNRCKGSFADIPTLCFRERALCCRVLALSCLCNRRQYFNDVLLREIAEELDAALSFEDLNKLMFIVKQMNDVDNLEKSLGVDADDRTRQRVNESKKNGGNSIIFGGRSIYGNLVDAACQRYGWSLEYLLWEISYANVHFMLKDAINSVYLSEEERKKLHLSGGSEQYFDGNDPEAVAAFMQMTD